MVLKENAAIDSDGDICGQALTEEGEENSVIYEEGEEEEEEIGDRESGKFTRYPIMNVAGEGVVLRKLLFVLTFLLLAAFSNWVALAYIHDFEALPDIVFSVVPELLWTLKVGDAMVTLCSTFFFTLLFLHKNRLIIIQRIAFIVACLYTMRTISLLCTQLPPGYIDNNKRCRSQNNRTGQNGILLHGVFYPKQENLDFRSISHFPVSISKMPSKLFEILDMDNEMLCGDLLFSGHTLAMVVSSLTVAYYLPDSFRPLRYIPRLLSWVGMICMVISRTHYTIDVLFAYWLSTAVFSIYHAFCEIDLTNRKLSVLYRLWVMQIVSWLEVDITPGRIENRFEFPLLVRLYKWWSNPSKNHYHTQNNRCHHQIQQQIPISSALSL
ncbi:putative phosphatidylcholine:ceramide cholinephosphotransferase 3 [Dirofilaria immitis]|nr:putative phosphatidylcholine:ceramide cholinephosphotransferase 3 [Dirofilaria immitis]